MNIIWKPASDSNYSEGRDGNSIDAIVVHWIVGTLEIADKVFADGRRNVSAHYSIGDDEIHQHVKDEDTAWHCGDWLWNLKTIGIEHEGSPDLPISDATYETSAQLIKELSEKYDIPLDKEHILPHNHFVATQCPGTLDIDRLIELAKGDSEVEELKAEIERLENEITEISSERDRKDKKLETCRVERADYKAEVVEVREQYQKQVAELNQTNSSLSNDVQRLSGEIDKKESYISTLEEDKKALKSDLEALKEKLEVSSQKYLKLEEKYVKCNDKLKDTIKNTKILELIWKKLFGR